MLWECAEEQILVNAKELIVFYEKIPHEPAYKQL